MGIYQRMGFMGLSGFLDNTTTEHGSILPNAELYFIYRITSSSGHTYYGCTKDLKQRMYSHFVAVMGLLEGREPTLVQELHKVLATDIALEFEAATAAHKGKKPLSLEKFARDRISFYILCVTADKESAHFMERYYIDKHFNDPMCMNQRVPPLWSEKETKTEL